MVELDLEFEGEAELQSQFEVLIEKADTDAVYEVGTTADYAEPLEFGRGGITVPSDTAIPIETESETIFRQSVSGHPPYPFFRPALREARNDLDGFVTSTLGASLQTADSVQDALRMIALSLETQIKINLSPSRPGRSPGTHPDHPQVDTGNLRASTTSRRIR